MSATEKKVIRRPLPCSCKVGESCEKCISFREARRVARMARGVSAKVRHPRVSGEKSSSHHEQMEEMRRRGEALQRQRPAAKEKRPEVVGAVPAEIPKHGPGTEFTELLRSVGLTKKKGCSCAQLAILMNQLGVDGCRRELDRLVKQIEANRNRYGLLDYAKAAVLAVANGLAFQVDWSDPIPGLLTEAIRRADEKQKQG